MTRAAPPFDPIVDAPVCVGFSGGLDSTALLHALATDARIRTRGLRALHVHHGMQADADDWAAHCIAVGAQCGVEVDVVQVDVRASGLGREGAAREARYAAFAGHLRAGEHLALAHHRDDQAETFLLRALRASGVDGLAAMSPLRPLARGVVWRPWLAVSRETLRTYANAHGLKWLADPSNGDASLDRVFLREQVMPLLRQRWPSVDAALARSAALAAQASSQLQGDDVASLAACTLDSTDTLSIPALRALSPDARARVLRRWIAGLGLPPLPANGVERITRDLLDARDDAQARFDWHGATARAWRDRLRASRLVAPLDATFDVTWDGLVPLVLPNGGRLALDPPVELPANARVRARRGGERIRLAGRTHHHALKDALRDAGIAPWIREQLPLLVVDDTVWAAGDRVVGDALARLLDARGSRVVWTVPA
ncbi:tRNA lysidine(34) synthetase TilS [Lysobacter sp. TY2-98]|uniref:tRNA lysidine(34) synthetase TilS n=1 Tax=Lysobacter sp. TY2-98 TaxID=2290922 RepID=UPI000E209ED4|nr:tRNA lysidine(34) synthetase TilS [Lysobacter sp. TY2-98]AXK71566.1 tRNA lysidine(34) synthetase TilS [Lysobacter sp. TY2-98]